MTKFLTTLCLMFFSLSLFAQCSKCGAQFDVGDIYCGHCGTKLQSPSQTITLTANGVSFDMIYVEPGTFMMGSNEDLDEMPIHKVTLTRGYFLGKHEVTQELWIAVMGSNPSHFKGDNLPVDMISWNDAKLFVSRLNEITGKKFRLPSEAEWEFACRGGIHSRGYKYSGSNDVNKVAWYRDNSDHTTHPVGGKLPNELGFYDMSGNVFEWCEDRMDDYEDDPQTNPKGAESGAYRVDRGGSWHFSIDECTYSSRFNFVQNYRLSSHGLRIAL